MNPAVSAKEKPSAGRREPATRPDNPPAGKRPPGPPQTQLRVRYYRRMNVQRVYPLTVEVPALRAGQVPPPVVESIVVRPVIPGALVVPGEQKLDPNRPGATARFHVTPLALGWLPDSRIEVHHPGRPLQEIPLGSQPMSMLLWLVLLILFFPIVVPLRLLLGPWGGPPRSVSQWPTVIMLLLALLLPTLLLITTRYAPMRGSIIQTYTDPTGGPAEKIILPAPPVRGGPMPPGPMIGGVAPGAGGLDEKKEEKKDEPREEKKEPKEEKKDEPKEGKNEEPKEEKKEEEPKKEEPPRPPGGGGGGGPGAQGLSLDGSRVRRIEKDFSDQPGVLLTDRLNTLFEEQFPQLPVLSTTVYPTIASWLGNAYGMLSDVHNQRELHPSFWTCVVLLLFTGLCWVTHSSYRAVTRKSIDLTPRVSDAETIETLPLSPDDRPPSLSP